MKKITLASLNLLIGLISFGQGTSTEEKSITENGITKSWTIKKEFDAQGNMIDYDSTYSEKEASKNFAADGFNKPFNKESMFDKSDFQMFDMDSLMASMKSEMEEMKLEMKKMMEEMKLNSLKPKSKMSPNSDQSEDEFNFPDKQNNNKPKGTRI